jgi:hypothetical protein
VADPSHASIPLRGPLNADPTIAGKISNNGPYDSFNDVYKLKLLSKAEKRKIKEYESEFTATPSTGLDTMRGRDPYRRRLNK